MDDNNRFLSSYKKRAGERTDQAKQAEEPKNGEIPQAGAGSPSLRYEEKSGFVRPPRRETPGSPPPGKRPPIVLLAIAAVVVVAGLAALIWYLNRGIAVIEFKEWSVSDAQLWADEKGVNLQLTEQYSDQYGEGRIIAQDPAKGATVSKGGFIRITVSKGHDLTVELPLPDLMSMTKEEIEAWANENFMTKVRITAEFSDEVAEGKVISFQINDNTVVDKVKRSTPIYVIVSKGGEDQEALTITVPNFREKTVADSYLFAKDNGITLTIEEQFDDYAPKGSIISQSVKADEKVKKGAEISLIVSKGKEIRVPDFTGYSKAKATALTTELGIPVSIVEKYSSKAAGEFISQSLQADSVYNDGDVLELYYSLGNKIVVASFVGQTRDAAETWAQQQNAQGASIAFSATYTQSNQPKGKIIYQDKENTLIGIKTTIKLTISAGKAVYMPDFVAPEGSGYDVAITREEAITMCEALNIVPVFVKSSKAGRLPGEIWSQSVAAGKEVAEGSTITLKYNPSGTTVTVPDFSGMTEADIRGAGWLMQLDITFATGDAYVDGKAGRVVKQSARAGSKVAAGTAVTLTLGPEQAQPPAEPTA